MVPPPDSGTQPAGIDRLEVFMKLDCSYDELRRTCDDIAGTICGHNSKVTRDSLCELACFAMRGALRDEFTVALALSTGVTEAHAESVIDDICEGLDERLRANVNAYCAARAQSAALDAAPAKAQAPAPVSSVCPEPPAPLPVPAPVSSVCPAPPAPVQASLVCPEPPVPRAL